MREININFKLIKKNNKDFIKFYLNDNKIVSEELPLEKEDFINNVSLFIKLCLLVKDAYNYNNIEYLIKSENDNLLIEELLKISVPNMEFSKSFHIIDDIYFKLTNITNIDEYNRLNYIEIDIFNIPPKDEWQYKNLGNDIHVKFRTRDKDLRLTLHERNISDMIIASGGRGNLTRIYIDSWFTNTIVDYFSEITKENENPSKTYESLVCILEFCIISLYDKRNIESGFKTRINNIEFVVNCK